MTIAMDGRPVALVVAALAMLSAAPAANAQGRGKLRSATAAQFPVAKPGEIGGGDRAGKAAWQSGTGWDGRDYIAFRDRRAESSPPPKPALGVRPARAQPAPAPKARRDVATPR